MGSRYVVIWASNGHQNKSTLFIDLSGVVNAMRHINCLWESWTIVKTHELVLKIMAI